MNDQNIQQSGEKTYVCLGSCQAVISEEQYKNGLTKCGAEECTLYNQPFVPGKKDESTGQNTQVSEE